jgi:hypothetical protein
MNYHFTTTKAHFNLMGATVLELFGPEALNTQSTYPFKGNMDLGRLKDAIDEHGAAKIPFVRMEATTNLIGGQPFSLANLREVKALIAPLGIPLVLDASLISENAYFIRQREAGYENKSIKGDHPGDDEAGGSLLSFRAQELHGSRRPDRHQPQGFVRSDPALASGVRRLLHLRRNVIEGNRGDGGGHAGDDGSGNCGLVGRRHQVLCRPADRKRSSRGYASGRIGLPS